MPKASDLRPSIGKELAPDAPDTPATPQAPSSSPRPPAKRRGFTAAAPQAKDLPPAIGSQGTPPTPEHVQEQDATAALLHVRWVPTTEVFDFRFNEYTTVSELKTWLAPRVACGAPHMQLRFGLTELSDAVPLCQYVGHENLVLARPKAGG